jgi:hypothetical protein
MLTVEYARVLMATPRRNLVPIPDALSCQAAESDRTSRSAGQVAPHRRNLNMR